MEIKTPLQEEFRRRMRGALLNIPLEDGNRHSNNDFSSTRRYNHLPTHSNGNEATAAQTFHSGLVKNREKISSILYASLPDNPEGNSVRLVVNECSLACSPRRSAYIPLPSVDPYSHDQLEVLHRCTSSINSHGDSLPKLVCFL